MAVQVATHSGPFHADDVLAWAMIRVFYDADAALVRTRDQAVIDAADLAIDVGGDYDPARLRFDHHQQSYQGPLSSAGMILDWLTDQGRLSPELSAELREEVVDYVDDVDNGRRAPQPGVPCLPRIVDAYNQGCSSLEDFDRAFRAAGEMAAGMVRGLVAGHESRKAGAATVRAAMADAESRGSNLLLLDEYIDWKDSYFDNNGEEHPTEFVLLPGVDGRWRSIAIPPQRDSFGQKRSFPAEWAGLRDEELAAVTGVPGALFCHKNRFIAVFLTREGALEAMGRAGLLRGDPL